jgi:hypothetical protein
MEGILKAHPLPWRLEAHRSVVDANGYDVDVSRTVLMLLVDALNTIHCPKKIGVSNSAAELMRLIEGSIEKMVQETTDAVMTQKLEAVRRASLRQAGEYLRTRIRGQYLDVADEIEAL